MAAEKKSVLAAIRSDTLRHALNLREASSLLRALVGDIVQIVVVLDASAAQSELRWRLRSRNNPTARTRLHEAIDSGAVIAVAPIFLKQEIEKYLPRIASEMGATIEDARAEWERVQGMICFYAPNGDGAEFASVDPKDSPYAQTAKELDADFVRTSDKHFKQMGRATLGPGSDGVLREYARSASVVVGVRVGSGLTLMVGGQALVEMGRGATVIIRKLPPAVKLTLAAGLAIALLHPRSRQKLIQWSRKMLDRPKELMAVLAPIVEDAFNYLSEAATTSKTTGDAITSRLRTRGKQTASYYARQVCLRSQRPLAAEEIARRIRANGYTSRSKTFAAYVRRLLRRDPAFVMNVDGLWTFGNAER